MNRLLYILILLMLVSCGEKLYEPDIDKPVPEPSVRPDRPDVDPEGEYGWYDAPYIRYEAEPGVSSGTATYMSPSQALRDVQSEATHFVAAQLDSKGSYLEWTCVEDADGMVIRFSLPDAPQGGGVRGDVEISIEGTPVDTLTLDSYHAWQYWRENPPAGEYYLDNTPGEDKYPRMQYDETRILLKKKVKKGEKFRITKIGEEPYPYTIDFVEMEWVDEPLEYEDVIDGTTVCFNPEKDDLCSFIIANSGRKCFIPAGRYDIPKRLDIIGQAGTHIIGAGVWHTELYFSADPNSQQDHENRGIRNFGVDNVTLENLYIDTSNERRYFDYQGGMPMGKGLMGDWGSSSHFKNIWIQHFECGGWLSSSNMHFEECRIRYNYADGINFNSVTNSNKVERCNFRANGDDNLAVWTNDYDFYTRDFEFSHTTIELGWRASGLAIVGGRRHKAHHIHIRDMFENGIRVVTDFTGIGFDYMNYMEFDHILIENCGANGELAALNTREGYNYAALEMAARALYDNHHVKMNDVIIRNSTWAAISFLGRERKFHDIEFSNIIIDGWKTWGIYSSKAKGSVSFQNLVFMNGSEETQMNPIPEGFEIKRDDISEDSGMNPSPEDFAIDVE